MNPARRRWVFVAALAATRVSAQPSVAKDAWSELRDGAVLIMRHAATDPGIGDPPGFRLDDCATQRNLSEQGRAQVTGLGRTIAQRRIAIARVESSAWCRCLETARLAFPANEVRVFAPLNSFFDDRTRADEQTEALRTRIAAWKGPGVLALVTHQVNISALTGRFAAMGSVLVLRPEGAGARVVGEVSY
jgi:broad specificity phosphatase PhoE